MPTSVDCCCCCCQVCQSALALLGHVLKYETGPTEPDVGVFLDIVQLRLEDESARAAAKTRANALWALVHAVDNRSVSDDRLLTFTDQLIATVKRTDDHPGSSTWNVDEPGWSSVRLTVAMSWSVKVSRRSSDTERLSTA